jgi:hypothetical protein
MSSPNTPIDGSYQIGAAYKGGGDMAVSTESEGNPFFVTEGFANSNDFDENMNEGMNENMNEGNNNNNFDANNDEPVNPENIDVIGDENVEGFADALKSEEHTGGALAPAAVGADNKASTVFNEAAEDRQTAHEIKVLILVFIFGILISFGMQEYGGKAYTKLSALITASVVFMLISSMIGRLLWNKFIVELFPFLRPARSFEYILALMIFCALVLRA